MDTPTRSRTTDTDDSTASAHPTIGVNLIALYLKRFVVNRSRYLTAADFGWYTVKKKLATSLIESALRGHTHLGLIPVSTTGLSSFTAWDADTDDHALALLSQLQLLPQASVIIERSRRGLHLYRLFAEPVPWDAAFRLGQAYAIKCGIPQIEIYPTGRQSRGLRAPITKHPKTGEVYGWLSPDGETVDAWNWLQTLTPSAIPQRWLTPPKVFERVIPLELGSYADLFNEVSQYTRLSEKGGEKAKGRCPFHDDTNPSFGILHGYFRCWACGVAGGLLAFKKLVKERGL